jgi:hypothetical protein
MSNSRYQAIIVAATETRNIDFKAAMAWLPSENCNRFELLKDIAALANIGGGHLVIGRDEPSLTTGGMTKVQVASFDPTEVNKLVQRFLSPAHECFVKSEEVGNDSLVIIDVPEFEASPLIFRETGNCGSAKCKKTPHFRPGDIYIRTKAQQSQRISDAEEMRELLNRGVRKTGDQVVTAIQRMLSAPQSVEEPAFASPYEAEYDRENEQFFSWLFFPWTSNHGHYDLQIHPIEYRSDRLDLRTLPNKIRTLSYLLNRRGFMDGIPYEGNTYVENSDGGCRLSFREPQFHQVEGVSLLTSGHYRLVREFPEDFESDKDHKTGIFVADTIRKLWIDTFIDYVTMMHLLARNVVREIAENEDEEFQVDFRIDSLDRREVTTGNRYFNASVGEFFLRLQSHAGTESYFSFPLRTTRRALEVDAVKLARERCERILWTFGISNEIFVGQLQRRLLGRTEPVALPAPA